MRATIEHIGLALKKARTDNDLSQRALSRRVGIPQSHISKIENGAVDLTLTSLIELSRALDLEPMLVPRRLIPAVQSLIRTSASQAARPDAGGIPTGSSSTSVTRSAYSLDENDGNDRG
jgi:transcriptional regulator with XRE-family HTH domain